MKKKPLKNSSINNTSNENNNPRLQHSNTPYLCPENTPTTTKNPRGRPRKSLAPPNANREPPEDESDLHSPTHTQRIGNYLQFLFPVIGSIPCTERGCIYRTIQGPWYSKKGNLKKHLERAHKMVFESNHVQSWCSFCQQRISNNKVVLHHCLQELREQQGREVNYQMLTLEEYEAMHFKWPKCTIFASDNKRALNSHFRIHNEHRPNKKLPAKKNDRTPHPNASSSQRSENGSFPASQILNASTSVGNPDSQVRELAEIQIDDTQAQSEDNLPSGPQAS